MYRDSLLEMVHELDIEESVTLPGYIDSDDLPLLLNSVDAFVMPSSAELQSIATLEAMSCGKPILAANARALPELVEHGSNGFLFNPQNAQSLAENIRLSSQHARALGRDGQGVAVAGAAAPIGAHHQALCRVVRKRAWPIGDGPSAASQPRTSAADRPVGA